MPVNYSLYLVTGRDLLPPGKDYFESLEESLQGGVTLVQIREKNTETAEFLDIAIRSVAICSRYNVPVLINDRVDIALASKAQGVHVGQTDMPVAVARKLLSPGSIIGVSTNNVKEVQRAIKDGADYVGIGAVWGTQTKKLSSPIVGVRGVGPILEELVGTNIKAVAIGGIKSTNLLRTLHGTVSPSGKVLDGVAIVSDIVASELPKSSASVLSGIFKAFCTSASPKFGLASAENYTIGDITASVGKLLEVIRQTNPLIHQITNTVVSTQSANATLALGASPIMSASPEEMDEISAMSGGLLINTGTLATLGVRDAMRKAGQGGNKAARPVVLDPVGVGATTFRKEFVAELLDSFQTSVIKGNAGEIGAIAGSIEVQSKGVDSVGSGFKDPVTLVRNLARKERCIVFLTGETDYISNGENVAIVRNGHEILGRITGSGCMLGTCVTVFCAAACSIEIERHDAPPRIVRGDMFVGALGGLLALTVAAEIAMERESVKGSGTFLPALIDELGSLTAEKIAARAKFELV